MQSAHLSEFIAPLAFFPRPYLLWTILRTDPNPGHTNPLTRSATAPGVYRYTSARFYIFYSLYNKKTRSHNYQHPITRRGAGPRECIRRPNAPRIIMEPIAFLLTLISVTAPVFCGVAKKITDSFAHAPKKKLNKKERWPWCWCSTRRCILLLLWESKQEVATRPKDS